MTTMEASLDRVDGIIDEIYYRSGRLTVSQGVALTELARRLVQLSKEGVLTKA